MRIKYASDLHVTLNKDYFNVSENYIIDKLNLDNIDILVLAGDTDEYPNNLSFCEILLNKYPKLKIVEVGGNHLYYSGLRLCKSIQEIDEDCRKFSEIENRYFYLNNNTVEIDNITFIGSVMWTGLGEYFGHIKKICNTLNDFNYILNDKLQTISPTDIIKQHNTSKKFIIESINKCETEKCIVATHHAPFLDYIDSISHAFGVNLDEDFKKLKRIPDYWIYAHTHKNLDKELNCGIKCLCNQFGYKGENQYGSQFDAWKTFDTNKFVDI